MVLSYLRLGSGASDFLFQTYDLHDVIIQAVHKYAPQFVRNRVRLTYEPVHAAVVTDEKWLLFILEQLLSNAVKYTPAGSVTIAVLLPGYGFSDTGIGIAPEDLPRIFEKGIHRLQWQDLSKIHRVGAVSMPPDGGRKLPIKSAWSPQWAWGGPPFWCFWDALEVVVSFLHR